MGMAEVVPGVSGGTIAFVTGIYERLLTAITSVGPDLVTAYREEGWRGVWITLQGGFVLNILAGMVVGLVVGVFAITSMLKAYPPVVWAFFFGLILASAWLIGRLVQPWTIRTVLSLLAGFGVALAIVLSTPSSGSEALWAVYLSGVLAISGLLLPGISGSFILLILGMYGYIVPSVKAALSGADAGVYLVVFVFALGALTGLMTTSRVLKHLFERFPQLTYALLTGFMLGSLYKLWPWRVVTAYARDASGALILSDGKRKVLTEAPVWPASYAAEGEPYLLASIVAALVGVGLLVVIARFDNSRVVEKEV